MQYSKYLKIRIAKLLVNDINTYDTKYTLNVSIRTMYTSRFYEHAQL